ncbi:MAG: isoprenylcysteine carboxylmethyltransferase family protein [Haloarculaceae archaeon]
MSPPFLHAPYRYVLYAAYAVWAVPEVVDAVRREAADGPDFDAHSKHVLYVTIGVAVAVAIELGLVAPAWATFGVLAVPLFWLGVGLVLLGVGVRWYSVAVLADAFSRSVTVTESQGVVRTGPYAVVRHPSYTGSLLTFAGLGFALGTWVGLLVALGLVTAGYGYRIRIEERVLRRELDGYADYCADTPYRLVPGMY